MNFKKIGKNCYQLEKLPFMKAEVVFYANEKILRDIQKDLSLQQLAEAASLPKVVSPVIGMPDIHEGFGLPIGGVMATEGLISVGAVGMDINCGVRLLTSKLSFDEKLLNATRLYQLIRQIEHLIPVGLGGRRKKSKLSFDLQKVTTQGVKYLVEKGLALKEDLEKIEENGSFPEANFSSLTPRAAKRAMDQLGTLGSGNHFIEIQKVAEVFDQKLASRFNLEENQICVMVHTGSRALGHQTCIDYTNIFWEARNQYGIEVPRIGFAALPLETLEAQRYFQAMACSTNFAFCNRQVITYFIREVFEKNFGVSLNLLYDVAHNIAKWETHQGKEVLVHRKGATRALPAGHPQNPEIYKETGHPAIVPGSMGTASYVMVGLPKNEETFDSINHGAGRVMSRSQAKKTIKKEDFEQSMKNIIFNKPFYVIVDEAPGAYKDIHEVIDTLVEAELTSKVAKLIPLAVIKGD